MGVSEILAKLSGANDVPVDVVPDNQMPQNRRQGDIPVDIVPDSQMAKYQQGAQSSRSPQYGFETQRKDWQGHLGDILGQMESRGAVGRQVKANEAAKAKKWEKEKFYAPWDKGATPAEKMPYLYARPGEELDQARWEAEWPWKQKEYEYNLNKPYSTSDDGSKLMMEIEKEARLRALKDPRLWTGESAGAEAPQGYFTLQELIDSYVSEGSTEEDAALQAAGDARLWKTQAGPPEGSFALPELVDAYKRDLAKTLYGNQIYGTSQNP